MAYINRLRGDLDGAMKLYQQSLEIMESLGDVQGKSLTLAMLGQLLIECKEYPSGIRALFDSVQSLSLIGARPDAEKVAEILVSIRQEIGAKVFDNVWKQTTGSDIPDWLTQSPQLEQSMTAEQFIAGAIQSAREKRPEAEEYFKSAQKMAADASAPAETSELGRVLTRIMAGDTDADLSALTREVRKIVQSVLNR